MWAVWLRWSQVDCSMAGMEPQRWVATVWASLFDRLVARWLFAFIALSALGLALLTVLTQGWVHLVLSLPVHLLVAVVAGGIALLTRSPRRRRSAVICLLGDLAAAVPNLVGVGGPQWRGLLTGVLLLPVFVPATRRALSAEPVDVIVGGGQPPRSRRPGARWRRRSRRRRSTAFRGRCWSSTRVPEASRRSAVRVMGAFIVMLVSSARSVENDSSDRPPRSTYSTGAPSTNTTSAPALRPGR